MNVKDFVAELATPGREGCTTWLYCDSRGLPTIGIGNMVPNVDAMLRLPMVHSGSGELATDDEKRNTWKDVVGAFKSGTLTAAFYLTSSDLRLPRPFVAALAEDRITHEFVPGIIRLCHDFGSWPEQAQRGIVDMAYNLGLHGLASFVNLLSACQRRDWKTAASECHRATCRHYRNAWTEQMFLDAAAEEPSS